MRFQFPAFLNFLFSSKNRHGVHSPFVFDFVCFCLNNRRKKGFWPTRNFNPTKTTRVQLLQNFANYFKPDVFIDYSLKNELKMIPEIPESSVLKKLDQAILRKNQQALIFIDCEDLLQNEIKNLFSTFSSKSLLIVDGIHLNKKNEEIWEQLKNDAQIKLSVDLFFWGIIFFKQNQAKQHFKIRL